MTNGFNYNIVFLDKNKDTNITPRDLLNNPTTIVVLYEVIRQSGVVNWAVMTGIEFVDNETGYELYYTALDGTTLSDVTAFRSSGIDEPFTTVIES